MKPIDYTKYRASEVSQMMVVEESTPSGKEIQVSIYATTVTATECSRSIVELVKSLGADEVIDLNK